MAKLSNYDPGLFEIYSGVFHSKKPVVMKFPNKKMAQSFALRLHRLRREMRKENHHLLVAAESCTVRVDPQTFEVTIEPADARYMAQIQEALARLHEISPEIEDHELNHTSLHSPSRGNFPHQGQKDENPPAPSRKQDDGGDEVSPAQKALEAFMKGEKK